MKRKLASLALGTALAAALVGCGAQAQPVLRPASTTAASPSVAAPSPSPQPQPSPTTFFTVPTAAPAPSPSVAAQRSTVSKETVARAACGGDYYVNVDGNCVHRPVLSSTAPDGATAVCRDGTYSFSQHRQGTCSHHGGVGEWL